MKNNRIKTADSSADTGKGPPSVKGQNRRRAILQMAREVLIAEGVGGLTMGSLAARLSISLGNLQYYFPRRDDLIDALVGELCETYRLRLEALLSGQATPGDKLRALAAFMVEDYQTKEGSVIFWELWALSSRNDRAAEAVNKMHEVERQGIEALIKEIAPRLSPSQAHGKATVIASMYEGVGLYVAPGRPQSAKRRSVARHLGEAALVIAIS